MIQTMLESYLTIAKPAHLVSNGMNFAGFGMVKT